MLPDNRCGVCRNGIAVGESRPNDAECLLIQLVLLISWNYHHLISDHKIGISGWQTPAPVVSRLGYRKLEQSIGFAFDGVKRPQLSFHFSEIVVLLALLVIGTYI